MKQTRSLSSSNRPAAAPAPAASGYWISLPHGLHQRVPLIFGAARRWSLSKNIITNRAPPRGMRHCSVAADYSVRPHKIGDHVSVKHPVIAITGSSGAGTTSVMRTFQQIFRRENVKAAYVEGDSFHRFDRAEMKQQMTEKLARGNYQFSHFGPEANLLDELAALFRDYGATGTRTRPQIFA